MSGTAILVFIRSEADEVRHKRLIESSRSSNKEVVRLLNHRVIHTACETGLPHFVIDSRHQVGTTFSERFRNAFQAIFNLGFDRVISVGNDVPNLKMEHILDAERRLLHADLSFGRTQKRGVFLFGLNKETFNRIDFDALKWQHADLIPSLFDVSSGHDLHIDELDEVLYELNTPNDIKQFLERSDYAIKDSLIQLLTHLSWNQSDFFSYSPHVSSNLDYGNFALRGPPIGV